MISPRPPLQPWTFPFLLALTGVIIYVGSLSVTISLAICAEVVGLLVYVAASRRRVAGSAPPSNLLSLLPGHLLLLLCLCLVTPGGSPWVYLWLPVPVLTVAYDAVFRWRVSRRCAMSISLGAYAILWASLVTLLERIIVLGRGLEGYAESAIAAVLGVAGAAFIALGVYRHRRAWTAAKE